LHALAHTLQVGRAALPARLAVVASDLDALVEKLEASLSGELLEGCYRGSSRDSSRELALFQSEPSAARAFLRELVDSGRLERVGELWVHGVSVDWSRTYRDNRPGVVRAPTYPFARDRHFIDVDSEVVPSSIERASRIESLASLQTPELVVRLVHRLTKTSLDEIPLDATLADVGVDSLIAMQLLVQIERTSGVRVHLSDLRKRPTLSELVRLIDARKVRGNGIRDRYPELEVMQEGSELTPVFWFHGGFGTVQPYVPLVRAVGGAGQLPFYAIQARGIRTDDAPITDLVEMAQYYAEIILNTQPAGECQIGGYSHGGRVAYEVARQLQLQGRQVKNIVMIDSAFPLEVKMSERTRYIISLFNVLKTANVKVSREDMAEILASADLVGSLVGYGVRAGVRYTEGELRSLLRRMATVLGANLAACNKYASQLQDLPDPFGPSVHYFIRGRQDLSYGPFLGDIMPREGEIALGLRELNRLFDRDEVALWRTKLPQLQAVRTPSEDHMTMFDDPETIRTIAATCRRIYGVEENDLLRVSLEAVKAAS
jgi:thioesterase domain-containing protein/aryl carrier-like protein